MDRIIQNVYEFLENKYKQIYTVYSQSLGGCPFFCIKIFCLVAMTNIVTILDYKEFPGKVIKN